MFHIILLSSYIFCAIFGHCEDVGLRERARERGRARDRERESEREIEIERERERECKNNVLTHECVSMLSTW